MADAHWVRAGTEGTPLIAVHTWSNEARHFADLSAALGRRTIYSLLPPIPGVDAAPRRVDDWVDHCTAVLDELDIEPPHRIVGWSFGGVVALELARRLRAAGTAVTYVGMIDTIRPRLLPLSDREYVWYHLGAAAAMPDAERIPYLRQKAGYLAYRRFPQAGAAVRGTLVRLGYRRDRVVKHSTKPTDPMMIAVHTSYLNYRGEGVPFPVHLYATEGSRVKAREPALRWAPWLHGGFQLHDIPGGHFTLFDPEHLTGLADALRTDLDGRPLV